MVTPPSHMTLSEVADERHLKLQLIKRVYWLGFLIQKPLQMQKGWSLKKRSGYSKNNYTTPNKFHKFQKLHSKKTLPSPTRARIIHLRSNQAESVR